MPLTIEQLAADYARRLRIARDRRSELDRMVEELNALPMTTREKHRVVDRVNERLGRAQRPGGLPTPHSGDNARYLDLVRAIKMLIK